MRRSSCRRRRTASWATSTRSGSWRRTTAAWRARRRPCSSSRWAARSMRRAVRCCAWAAAPGTGAPARGHHARVPAPRQRGLAARGGRGGSPRTHALHAGGRGGARGTAEEGASAAGGVRLPVAPLPGGAGGRAARQVQAELRNALKCDVTSALSEIGSACSLKAMRCRARCSPRSGSE